MKKLLAMIFLQMLPATLVVAAIRPLFAQFHGGNVSMMHAFMSLNMVGAVVAATPIAMLAGRLRHPAGLLGLLAASDAILLLACALPFPTLLVLVLRFMEGAAHVGAASMLLAEAAAIARQRGEGRVMGLAGAAIVFAIAAGNGLGGALVAVSPRAPFLVAAGIAALIAVMSRHLRIAPQRQERRALEAASLLLPLSAAFVERFAVGCVVVSFSLFAHERHRLTDPAIGWLFFALTFTFAVAMSPAGRLSDRIAPRTLLPFGAMLYAIGIASLAFVPAPLLSVAMIAAGTGAALTFAPSLAIVAAVGKERRTAAMALINSAGCLGMMLGTMTSGIAIAVTRDYGRPIVIAAASLFTWSFASWVGKLPLATLLGYGDGIPSTRRHRGARSRRTIASPAGAHSVADGVLRHADG